MAVQIFTDNNLFKQENVEVRTLIGYDDSCTIASVRRKANYEVEKWTDFNHVKKNFTSHLYSLKLSPSLISYFGKSFSIAIKQNKGDAKKIAQALKAIIPHAYGDHTLCGAWCEGNMDKQYTHKYLPKEKPLTDADLKVQVSKLINRYASNSQKISEGGSTQANKSINQIISTKCPKARHYAASESLTFRVSAAICQKNMGCQYSSSVFQKIGLRQSTGSSLSRQKKDVLRQIKKEGITYESGFASTDVSSLIPTDTVFTQEKADLTSCKILLYDLETTSLSHLDDIVQILAASFVEDNDFNSYIIPSRPFTKAATQITGLHISEEFSSCVKVFADSLQIFKCTLQDRKKQIGKFTLGTLLGDFVPEYKPQALHNAPEDVQVLKKLLQVMFKTEIEIKHFAKSMCQINEERQLKITMDLNKSTLLRYKDTLSSRIINKLSKVGITHNVMQQAFDKNKREGLRVLFTENVKEKPRVTKNSAVIEKVYNFFEKK
ncbi:uncharacterized protein LOC106638815 [Copidosoma floridanum]|uniref:uncharacterized protein LOC106638815 n=1 Tax=Copidosoma floridanum TaxID=29053 RepID=UPI0006C993D0|nr:uncharacterized protein LOC106638815 [Copidosoma floridanum]